VPSGQTGNAASVTRDAILGWPGPVSGAPWVYRGCLASHCHFTVTVTVTAHYKSLEGHSTATVPGFARSAFSSKNAWVWDRQWLVKLRL